MHSPPCLITNKQVRRQTALQYSSLVNRPSIPPLSLPRLLASWSIDFPSQQSRSRRRVRPADENRTVPRAGDSGWKHHPERGRARARGVVVSALFFFPRGGSAQVTRSL